ncbi:IS4 family transposase [Foetidibacter luteolus]|uniref:IS4 family transposase n=1 Tax=Foetidibacter luteolus TaxID=2608880 RepID=UPI00129B751B|nr:IS4 family transposase [Foetidibacter luteolus]
MGARLLRDFEQGLGQKVLEVFSAGHLMQVARETGFAKRSPRKLTPHCFLNMVLFSPFDNKEVSLNDHSVQLRMNHEIAVCRQSIDERFNENAVEFIRHLLAKQLSLQIIQNIAPLALENFSSVKLKDSTRFQLPDSLRDAYRGCGGSASRAGMHIQFEFDLKTGKVNEVNATDARRQDNRDAQETLDKIEKGSLLLRDTGYFSIEALQGIAAKEAFYISRLPPNINIYEKKDGLYRQVDLDQERQEMKRYGIDYRDKEVYIGEEQKHPVRIIMEVLPEEVVNQRMRKAAADARRKGEMLSDGYKAYASLNIFITNVTVQRLATAHVRTLYRLRWQIELRFKCWKGLCNIHKAKKAKRHRFECYLYARLLYILIFWELAVNLSHICFKVHRGLLSIYKCFKSLIQTKDSLKEILFYAREKLQQYLQKLYDMSMDNLVLENHNIHCITKLRQSFLNSFCTML